MVNYKTNTMTEKKFLRMSKIESWCVEVIVLLLADAKLTSSENRTPVLGD